jgi:peptidoglycan/LPS O-acetylase OafA/YrhL
MDPRIPTTVPPPTRLAAIDCLRGVASGYVALFHIYGAVMLSGHSEWVPAAVDAVFRFGDAGVQMFFVLSGFVLTFGLFGKTVNARFAGRFIIRRSIRLDPSYWTMIVVSLLAYKMSGNVDIPLQDVPFNFFYLDNVFQKRSIIPVGWTLCLEFQFYLILIGCCWALSRARAWSAGGLAWAMVAVVVSSIAYKAWGRSLLPPGLFLEHFELFALGVVLALWVRSPADRSILAPIVVVVAGVVVVAVQWGDHRLWLGVFTAAFIAWLTQTNRLNHSFGGVVLPWVGTISYSLYLVHPFVIGKLIRAAQRFLPAASSSPLGQVGLMVVALCAALMAAWAFWKVLERPTQRLAQRVSLSG